MDCRIIWAEYGEHALLSYEAMRNFVAGRAWRYRYCVLLACCELYI